MTMQQSINSRNPNLPSSTKIFKEKGVDLDLDANGNNTIRVGYSYPWAMNSDKKNFRTTSNAYGSHYKYYK